MSETATGAFTVCAVTVTYGDRWHLLSRVLDYLTTQPAVVRVVVVNNGAVYDLRARAAEAFGDRVVVVGTGKNEGSAAGFGAGMRAARGKTDCEFVWLLDDDNLPEVGCLDELQTCWKELIPTRKVDSLALQALRTDREYLCRIAAGADPKKVFARKNSFLDFHIADAPIRILRKLLAKGPVSKGTEFRSVKIPYGIYGGLFFHKELLDRVGYPNEAYVLYGDDNDYTCRINRGGEVFLVARGRVNDLENSWHVSKQRRRITVLKNLAGATDTRVYHSVRNGVFFAKKYLLTNNLIWQINRLLYLTILKVYMAAIGKSERYALIVRAVEEGLAGRLGKNAEFHD